MSVTGNRLAVAAVLMVAIGSLYALPVADWIAFLVAWGRQHSILGPIAYILFVTLATVLFLPGSVAMMIGGFVFGFLPGLLYAAIAIPLGSHCAFLVGRWVARAWVRQKFADNHRLQLLEGALGERAFVIIILTRLSLIIPFNLLNYVYGATSVRAHTHMAATALGMLPGIALFVYVGTLARNVSQILAGEAAPPELGYWVLATGLVAIAAVSWVIHRAASGILDNQLKNDNGAKPTT